MTRHASQTEGARRRPECPVKSPRPKRWSRSLSSRRDVLSRDSRRARFCALFFHRLVQSGRRSEHDDRLFAPVQAVVCDGANEKLANAGLGVRRHNHRRDVLVHRALADDLTHAAVVRLVREYLDGVVTSGDFERGGDLLGDVSLGVSAPRGFLLWGERVGRQKRK